LAQGAVESAREAAKVMFEVYREGGYNKRYRVVYYTELNDHNREVEFNRALAGETFFDGYLKEKGKKEAKRVISDLLKRLNDDEPITPVDVRRELAEYLA
jgi:hypothetical protein